MKNKIVKLSGIIILFIISFNCISSDIWSGKEAHMSCGTASVKVTAECKKISRNATDNICRDYQLEINNNGLLKDLQLPYIPTEQEKLLKNQGYSFNKVVKPGEWFPDMMKCYNNKFIIIGYKLGLTEEEEVNGSLLPYIDAPFFDLSGAFLSGPLVKDLRTQEIKNPYSNTKINFITNR